MEQVLFSSHFSRNLFTDAAMRDCLSNNPNSNEPVVSNNVIHGSLVFYSFFFLFFSIYRLYFVGTFQL